MSNTKSSLLCLPAEIIEHIVFLVYEDSNNTAASLTDLSVTCKFLRALTAPVLFHNKRFELDTKGRALQQLLLIDRTQWLKHNIILTLLSETSFAVLTSDRVAQLYRFQRRFFEKLTSLRVLRCEIFHTVPPAGLSILRDRDLHVILNLRNSEIGFDVQKWQPLTTTTNWRWSISASRYQQQPISSRTARSLRLVALKRVTEDQSAHPRTDDWLRMVKHSSELEEVHLIGEQIEIIADEEPVMDTQISKAFQHMHNIRRLRLQGSAIAWHLLPDLQDFTSLRHLTIYSGWRKSFHRTCNEKNEEPTCELPWLALPHLKHLDIRFICRHFSIEQIVPPGLLSLRIEFFSAADLLKAADLRWLSQACPDLDRLEFDIGSFQHNICLTALTTEDIPQETTDRLNCLTSNFRNIRILRFSPTYWWDGHMLPHPFPNTQWPVTLFRRLQPKLSSLRQLYICISYGEYPFDIVPQMEDNKPIKFRVFRTNDHELVLRSSTACSTVATETTWHDGVEDHGSLREVSVQYDDFFDDLDPDWNLPSYDFVGRVRVAQDVSDDEEG